MSSSTTRAQQPRERWLTTAEAAAHVAVQPRTIAKHCANGGITAYKFGTQWRLTFRALEAFVRRWRA